MSDDRDTIYRLTARVTELEEIVLLLLKGVLNSVLSEEEREKLEAETQEFRWRVE